MKILFLANTNDIHTIRWVNELDVQGHEIHLVNCSNHKGNIENPLNKSVHQYNLPFPAKIGYYLNALALKRLYKKINPDVCNAHYASGYGTLARKAKLDKLVLSVWGADVYDFPNKSKFHMKVIKKNLCYSQVIASTSTVMKRQVRSIIGDSKTIYVTPFGINLDRFRRIKKHEVKKQVVIGIVKKLEPKYGVKYLIEAFNELCNDNDIIKEKISPTLEIVGTGSQEKQLKSLVFKKGISDKVLFHGRLPNEKIPEKLDSFDIFALSSVLDSESFGVVAVEAMAAGLPVIATDVDGFTEVVDNNETGEIVPRGNTDALYKGLKKLCLSSELRSLYGLNGRKKVEKLYSFDTNVKYMVSIYKKYGKSL